LAIPSAAVTAAVGPLSGPPPVELAELDRLLAETPAFAGLSAEDRVALTRRARPNALPPGAPVVLAEPTDAVVVSSGALELPGGFQLRRGSMIGPIGDETDERPLAVARTAARTWTVPSFAALWPVGGPGGPASRSPRPAAALGSVLALGAATAPTFGVHP